MAAELDKQLAICLAATKELLTLTRNGMTEYDYYRIRKMLYSAEIAEADPQREVAMLLQLAARCLLRAGHITTDAHFEK